MPVQKPIFGNARRTIASCQCQAVNASFIPETTVDVRKRWDAVRDGPTVADASLSVNPVMQQALSGSPVKG